MANESQGPVFVTQIHLMDINAALAQLVERIDTLAGLRGAVTVRDRLAVSAPTGDADAVRQDTLTNATTGYVTLATAQTIAGAKTFSAKMTAGGEVEIDGALNHDGTTVGFYGTAPSTQPAANADTAGATLAQLETEVNQLKAALRLLGIIAT